MIELKDVYFSREKGYILEGVSFFVGSNERVAILGGSGAGKTTLLKLILGLERPDSGGILIDGEDITSMKEERLRRIRLKFTIVFQDGALFDSLSVYDNVAFYLHENRRLSEREIRAQVGEMLDRVGLGGVADEMPESLSGGMKRRVAIARALAAQKPKMFLYDEPTADLDPLNAEIICKLILKLSADEKGFLIVTHEILHALTVAQRFVLIDGGRVAFDGNRAALLDPDNRQIRKFMGGLNWKVAHQSAAAFSTTERS